MTRPRLLLGLLALLLVLLAFARPVDHDESQYVAAVQLASHGFLPYRDFAYFQTPLQPMLFGLLAVTGDWLWPAMRLANALLGVAAVAAVFSAARRAGTSAPTALIAAGLFAVTDILLFSVGVARNDALPAACLAAALLPIVRADMGAATRESALLAGLLLSAAVAAKLSYAVPALAYGLYALWDRRHRPAAVLAGALPMIALIGWTWWQAPANFVFDVVEFPLRAPEQYYLEAGRGWKLGFGWKLVDTFKFLALGAALPVLAIVARERWRDRRAAALDVLILAGLIAALLPEPTWRQYLLPILPPLFVQAARLWSTTRPGRVVTAIIALFAVAGLVPTGIALAQATSGLPLVNAMRDGAALKDAMDGAKAPGPVATLSPQYLPATGRLPDARLATGPFYFRSQGLLPRRREIAAGLVSRGTLEVAMIVRPSAVVVGGEGAWTAGDETLDGILEHWAIEHRYRRVPVASSHLRLYAVPP